MHWVLHCFYSRSEPGAAVLHPWFSLVNKPFTFCVSMFSIRILWIVWVYVFLTDWDSRVILPALQCWDRGCCSSLDLWLPPFFSRFVGLLWSPLHFVLLWYSLHFGPAVGCFGVILATIGPRTTQELFSLSKLWIACVTVCMQWLVFGLCWSRDEGLVCLINLVCLETTQTELEGWLSSPQPINSTGREVRAWGTV